MYLSFTIEIITDLNCFAPPGSPLFQHCSVASQQCCSHVCHVRFSLRCRHIHTNSLSDVVEKSLGSGYPSQYLHRYAEQLGYHAGEYALAKGAGQREQLEY